MFKTDLQTAFNKHINAEMYSSYLYLAMAAWFETQNLSGMAGWTKAQAREEWGHAMKFFGYVCERGGTVTLEAIEAPPAAWTSPLNAFEQIYEHECKITGFINALFELVQGEKDHASAIFLQQFITEQVEEEATAKSITERLRALGDSPSSMLLMDRALGERK
jgi:ferritin